MPFHPLTPLHGCCSLHAPPPPQTLHRAAFEDFRPDGSQWVKYGESPEYKNGLTLRDYQLEGVNWMIFNWYHRRNCILADEMGLGKTIQTTALLDHLVRREHSRGPFLIVAPLSTLEQWKREIELWTDLNVVLYHGGEGGLDVRYRWLCVCVPGGMLSLCVCVFWPFPHFQNHHS